MSIFDLLFGGETDPYSIPNGIGAATLDGSPYPDYGEAPDAAMYGGPLDSLLTSLGGASSLVGDETVGKGKGESLGIPTNTDLYRKMTNPLLALFGKKQPSIKVPKTGARTSTPSVYTDEIYKKLLEPKNISFMIAHPRALQMLQMIMGLKQQAQDREAQAKAMERQQQYQDFALRQNLDDRGYVSGDTPNTSDAAARFFGYRPTETPVGKYYVPTQPTRERKAREAYKAQKQIEAEAKMEGKDLIPVTIPAFGDNPAYRVMVTPKEYLQFQKDQKDTEKGKYAERNWQRDENTGEMHFFGIDKDGNQVHKVYSGLSPKQSKADEEKTVTPNQLLTMRRQFEEARSKAHEAALKAQEYPKDKDAAAAAQSAWTEAHGLGQALQDAAPDQFEYGTGTDEFKLPYVKKRTGEGGTSQAAPKAGTGKAPAAPKAIVPRAKVEAYAKKRGISYEEAARQAQAEGYQIQ